MVIQAGASLIFLEPKRNQGRMDRDLILKKSNYND
tara:strand:- start:426 stop:530 length:105 start_codon:yes stop_codon:yes gene_type:complete